MTSIPLPEWYHSRKPAHSEPDSAKKPAGICCRRDLKNILSCSILKLLTRSNKGACISREQSFHFMG